MRIPTKAKEIMGKTELWKNLYTADLFESNSKKHKEIDLMYKGIAQAISEIIKEKPIKYLRKFRFLNMPNIYEKRLLLKMIFIITEKKIIQIITV